MDVQNLKESLKNAADLLKETPAIRRRENMDYALVVRTGYEEIKKLRDEGHSWDIICETLSKTGALNAGAKPKNLCSAFLREAKRRLKRQQAPGRNIKASAGATPDIKAAGEESEKEKIRRLTSTTVETGQGKRVKHTDGSFDL